MWQLRIPWRIFGVYAVLVTVSFGLLGWWIIGRIEHYLLQQTQNGLEIKTLLIRDLVTRRGALELQEQISGLGQGINARVTLIAADGTVLADSADQPAKLENYAERAEVVQAESLGIGVSTHYSGAGHVPMMYVARRNDNDPVRYVRIAQPLEAVAVQVRWLNRAVWTATGLTLLVGLVLSMAIARRINAPLMEIAEAADSIAAGSYGAKVMNSSSGEMGALAASFNAMSAACAAHIAQMERDQEQLRVIFRGMVEGVLVLNAEQTILFVNEAAGRLLELPLQSTPGQKIWQVLRLPQLNSAVEEILASDEPYFCELQCPGIERRFLALHGNRLPGEPKRGAVLVFHDITDLRKLETVRQDFVANVSHELKTPLTVIQATVETLVDGAMQDDEHKTRFLERIRENAERLHRLVQDLLTLGRIESSQSPLEPEAISLQQAVEACVSRLIDRAKAKDLQLWQESGPEFGVVLADEEALAEILDNLVDNAIKYTPAGGVITLRWFAHDSEAILQVADTGVGIPEKDLPRVFERFYRVDKARSRELGGTGLGLSIVKHLVQALGGTIHAASEIGRGSVFSIHLPLAPRQTGELEKPKRLVFVCVENSNRSQMAEAFARIHGKDRVEAFSAGSRPSGKVNPRAIEAMGEIGYDLSRHASKSIAELPNGEFDVAITMGCGDECPSLRAKKREDWQIPDPKGFAPQQFRLVRDEIEQRVQGLLRRLDEPPSMALGDVRREFTSIFTQSTQ